MANHYIITFIQSLNSKETRLVEEYITSLASLSGASEESKQLKVFKQIVSMPGQAIESNELVNSVGTANLSSLLYHLSDKIYEALLLTKHLENDDIFEEREQIVFSLKKKILLIKVLYRTLNQGKAEVLEILLNDTIKSAKDHEIFDLLAEALTIKKYFKSIRAGLHEFELINREIDLYYDTMRAIQRANDSYFKLGLNTELIKSLSDQQLHAHIADSIKILENDYKKYKAKEINYYLLMLQMAIFERRKDYTKCLSFCDKLIKILKASKVIYSKNRMGFAHTNYSHYCVFLGKYAMATKAAQNAQKFHITNSFNYLGAKEQEFYSYFYDGNYKMARKATEDLMEHSLADLGEFRKSKFVYYQAALFFAESQFKDAMNLLNKSLEIDKDKAGWNISLRILYIQTLIELAKIDEASRSLESLRKYISRADPEYLKPRFLLITKALREMEKDGFEFNSKNLILKNHLNNLTNQKGSENWEYFSPELIPFHRWLATKTKQSKSLI